MRNTSALFRSCLALLVVCQTPATSIAQSRDSGEKGIADLSRMMAACPSGQRTAAQQRECERVIDSIQTDRRKSLDAAQLAAAESVSESFLMEDSFVPEDDGRKLPVDRWIRIGTIRGENGPRARVTMRVGRTLGNHVLVGAIRSEEKDLASVIVRVDCAKKQAQVIQVFIGENINVSKPEGIGPWLPLGKNRSVIQALARRTC